MPRHTELGNPAIHPDEDEFNRWPFSRALADRIAGLGNTEGAAVVGLYGRWGYGKSSVLNFIKHQLREQHSDKVILYEFNPWLFADRNALLTSFYIDLAKKLDIALQGTGKRVGKLLSELSGALGVIPWVGGALKTFGEYFGKKMAENPLESQRKTIENYMKEARRVVVVLIDDLDRLDREEIVMMLKLVRLTADLPNVVYVLAFDDEMVGQAVGTLYTSGHDAGRQFIEKIVQFPFAIPAVGQDRLVRYACRHARIALDHAGITVSDADWDSFRQLTTEFFSRRLTTPRQAIRFGSALDFAMPMLKGEVDPLQQMIVEGLRILFPELYAYVRDHTAVFTQADEERAYQLKTEDLQRHATLAMQKGSGEDLAAAHGLLDFLFLRYSPSPQPITRLRYFERLFGYAVAVNEIPDAELASLLSLAETDDDRLPEATRRLAEHNPSELLLLLRRANPSGPPCSALSRAIASCGGLFVKSQPVKDDSLAKDLVNLLARFVQRFRRPSVYDRGGALARHELAAALVGSIEPLPLAPALFDALDWLNLRTKPDYDSSQEQDNYVPVIAQDGWRMMFEALELRIRSFADADPNGLLVKDSDAAELFKLWGRRNRNSLKGWMEAQLAAHPPFSLKLLRYVGFEGAGAVMSDWKYGEIDGCVSPAFLADILTHHFPNESEPPEMVRTFLDEHQKHLEKPASKIDEAASDAGPDAK